MSRASREHPYFPLDRLLPELLLELEDLLTELDDRDTCDGGALIRVEDPDRFVLLPL